MSNPENHSLATTDSFPNLEKFPIIRNTTKMISPANGMLWQSIASLNQRYAFIGQEVFVLRGNEGKIEKVAITSPTEKDPWWPQVKNDRFTQLDAKTPWGQTEEGAKASLDFLPLRGESQPLTLQEQYRTEDRMDTALPEFLTPERAKQFGQDLAEIIAFFELTSLPMTSAHGRTVDFQFFVANENILPQAVFSVLKGEINVLRQCIATKMSAIKTILTINSPGFDPQQVGQALWNAILQEGHAFAEEHYSTLQMIALMARTNESIHNAARILRAIDLGKLREFAK